MAQQDPSISIDELTTINTLCDWIAEGSTSVADAMKLYREQYGVNLGYMIKNRIYHRLCEAVEKRK